MVVGGGESGLNSPLENEEGLVLQISAQGMFHKAGVAREKAHLLGPASLCCLMQETWDTQSWSGLRE